MKKKKILVLSDHPLSPSGVGTQTKYMIEALLKTGRYQFLCLGGAMIGEFFQLMVMVTMKLFALLCKKSDRICFGL